MDNGEGRNFNRTLQDDLAKADMTISTIVHAGAIPSQSSGVTVVDKDLTYSKWLDNQRAHSHGLALSDSDQQIITKFQCT